MCMLKICSKYFGIRIGYVAITDLLLADDLVYLLVIAGHTGLYGINHAFASARKFH